MRKFYISTDGESIIVMDPVDNNLLAELDLFLTEEDDEETEEEVEEEEEVPVKVAPKKKGSSKILHVTGENWRDFVPMSTEGMDEEEKKEYKKQYAKYGYYKKKEVGPVKRPKEESVEDEVPEEPKPAKNTGDALVETVAASEPAAKEFPVDLINRFGRLAVEVVYMEKNRGIGYTADEIFEQGDKRLKIFTLSEIDDIVTGLEAVGM